MTLYAYAIPLDQAVQQTASSAAAKQTAENAALNAPATAEATAQTPNTRTISGVFGGIAADELAESLEELAGAASAGFSVVPVYGSDAVDDLTDGYYILQSATTEPERPQAAGRLHRYSVELEAAGTRAQQLRAVHTSPNASIEQDIATPTTEQQYVGVDARATLTRWYDTTSGDLTSATPVDTTETVHGDVDLYDPTSAPTDAPALTYKLPYAQEYERDCVAHDTRGYADKESDGVINWQRVFATSHEIGSDAALVLSTRAIRVRVDEDAGTLTAEEWDASAAGGDGAWTDIALPASDWEPVDIDLVYLGPARIQAQVVFENASTGELATVDGRWHRGWDLIQWSRATGEPTPSGLVDLLEPTASGSVETPGSEAGLVKRSGEVRR
ncbi:hypothetical protein Hbl1158_02870 [Halobaculum sp. CBA1158]|uniref:hypothetical protein n=1 Tax=Halobaculum sp. CBA1158 TaxID=2904243 RepID=UPI001F19FCC9|nr:hypothetical protein [Halobaculum sp. CBA1158]UIP00329.1 hypothetical protein Hbl1158_02870 [Halobaculum sp. CBA1158]